VMPQRTILLTGATGVVGAALLPRLSRHRVICVAHRSVPKGAEVVMGDLRSPGLGLDAGIRRNLAREVDVVIHCAAATDFTARAQATRELNVDGTDHLLRFATDAGAVLHYFSTAFIASTNSSRGELGDVRADPQVYLASKRNAEQLVRDSGIPFTILRPSVVIGDTATGAIAKFQGLHLLAAAMLRNTLPLVPLLPDARVDIVPQDVLVDAVAALVDHDVRGGEYWITAGQAALTAGSVVDLIVEVGNRVGIDVRAPRLVDPEMIDRLIRPAFIEHLPPVARRRFEYMLAMTALVAGAAAFPTSLAEIPGCPPVEAPRLASAFDRSIDYFIRAMGWAASGESAA
jgi:nucleoside-diphosphate-sugar epimerase